MEIKETLKLINRYISDMTKTKKSIEKSWKGEEKEAKELGIKVIYPRIYSEQYYAYIKLIEFFKELKLLEKKR